MANKSREELLNRWRDIEEEDEGLDSAASSTQNRLLQLKEQWFVDAYEFLSRLPSETHIWCGYWDLMGPLVETFYNYYRDGDSPLKFLWARISEEMRRCTQCICQHHQAQQMYSLEYDSASVGPLLEVLQRLDEERVFQHLKHLNARIAQGGSYGDDAAEIVCVMFEVLTFPALLDDHSLVVEFQLFIEAIDDMHELALAGNQQYPGVYALLFFKSARVRSIGRRLAGSTGKLRRAEDLEPLQPLLKKCIYFLEAEVLPSTPATSRPRMQLDCTSVWLGINGLLGFLECPAFEDGLLERYPIFLSIVLNHISDESLEFLLAVKCLRRLFEMLGCRLWLRSTLSPGVMRNTLLGQCFHTRNEKSHKEIFDLFQSFLQSLEALQDGEHEEQRRHFLYFLLHQVPVSSNFSPLMRKKASQIALLIVGRGYKMNPPCPPYECAHFWGPSLMSSLKDSTLHSSLRQPAFDLIETIIVSDAAALIMSIMTCNTSQNLSSNVVDFDDERMDGVHSFDFDVKEEIGSWKQFVEQGKIAAQECRGWMCIPMLWIDVFVDINPTILPTSFSKAVFWARSRFPMIESEEIAEMSVSIRDWLSSSASEITDSFGWKVPTGSDDGGRGKESKNSVLLSMMHTQLLRTFKRLTTHFIVQTDRELWKQWTWVPMMAESLILFLMDTDDTLRQVGKCILEKLSDTRGLASGLKFLCSSKSSLSGLFLGLRHAIKLVQLDSSLLNFRALHGFFFVLCKILKEGFPCPRSDTCSDSNISKFSSEGGFLKQPAADLLGVTDSKSHTIIDLRSWEKFSFLLAKCAWPFLRRCLVEGKLFFNYKYCQMTCVRLLEIFPVVFERIFTSFHHLSEHSTMVEDIFDFKWFGDLVEWGNSSLEVVVRYWRQAVTSLLDVLKSTEDDKYTADIMALKSLVSCDSTAMDELQKQVSRLSVSLSKEASCKVGKKMIKSKAFNSGSLLFEREHSSSHVKTTSMEDAVHIINAETVADQKDDTNVIVLSDDEVENDITASEMHLIHSGSKHGRVDVCAMPFATDIEVPQNDIENKSASEFDSSKTILKQKGYSTDCSGIDSQQDYSTANGEQVPSSLGDSKVLGSKGKVSASDSQSHVRNSLKKSVDGSVTSSSMDTVPRKSERVLTELRHDKENDPWDLALKSERRHLFCITKPLSSIPKRKIIQLNLPMQGKSGLHRPEVGLKRFTPPNLDDWYRPILEIDYFAAVGLSASEDENQSFSKLQEIPVVFQSPEEYVGIFRPLVLEEFKSQLHSSYVEMSSLEEMHYGSVSVVSVERVDDFHLVRCVHDDSTYATSKNCSENDLVLLTRQPLKTSSHDVHLVGKVERHEKDNKRRSNILFIRFYLQNGSVRFNRARKFLAERTKWYLSRIMSITPQIREFQALSSLKQIPMLPIILKPDNVSVKFQKSQEFNLSKLSQPLQQILKSSYNECQLQAISVAIGPVVSNKDNALSLIQGPPGTGKTRTIVAVVSALLASSTRCMNETRKHYSGSRKLSCTNTKPSVCESVAIARAWQDAALARQLDKDMAKNLNPTGSSARGRILICAQSNAAVDPATRNRLVIFQPPENIVTQHELISLWEKKKGTSFNKVYVSAEEMVKLSASLEHPENVRVSILYTLFVQGVTCCDIGENDLEASRMYPELSYRTVDQLLEIFAETSKAPAPVTAAFS